MKADNARRFFLDLDDRGNVILSAPKRTEFDDREKWQHGASNVAPPEGQDMRAVFRVLSGFSAAIELGGRVFFVNIKSVPKEGIES